ncbi:MAG: OmpA family protein [bacterium]|jgi:OOP family OmpA-OmpF porin
MMSSKMLLSAGVLAAVLATTGCATKKYVREQTGAVDARLTEVDQKQTAALGSLEAKMNSDVSRVEERAVTAENRAQEAAKAAQAAQQTADQANTVAKNAVDAASKNQGRIEELGVAFNNIDNFRVASEQGILFRFDSANLTTEAQQELDQVVQTAASMNRYVIEVQGFTDRTGPADYNLALSRRRADAVVRYLVSKQIPLRRIHMIGLGEMTPSMAELTGQAQAEPAGMTAKEMRRVVVRVWAPEGGVSTTASAN